MKYDNPVKGAARGWAWNRINERIRTKDLRRRARVFVLIGDTTEELRVAQTKGFSRFNVIGVDTRPEPVKMWRDSGGIAIQAPIEAVVAFSKVAPHAIIADFCGGINDISFDTFSVAMSRCQRPGCIVMNLLRGRDQVEEFRKMPIQMLEDAGLGRISKKRSVIVLLEIFRQLYRDDIISDLSIETWPPTMEQLELVQKEFDRHFDRFKQRLQPDFYEYKSRDSNQWFDTIAINSTPMDFITKNGELMKRVTRLAEDEVWTELGYDVQSIKRKLAAMEAVRTQKLNAELKPHHHWKYQPLEAA